MSLPTLMTRSEPYTVISSNLEPSDLISESPIENLLVFIGARTDRWHSSSTGGAAGIDGKGCKDPSAIVGGAATCGAGADATVSFISNTSYGTSPNFTVLPFLSRHLLILSPLTRVP